MYSLRLKLCLICCNNIAFVFYCNDVHDLYDIVPVMLIRIDTPADVVQRILQLVHGGIVTKITGIVLVTYGDGFDRSHYGRGAYAKSFDAFSSQQGILDLFPLNALHLNRDMIVLS